MRRSPIDSAGLGPSPGARRRSRDSERGSVSGAVMVAAPFAAHPRLCDRRCWPDRTCRPAPSPSTVAFDRPSTVAFDRRLRPSPSTVAFDRGDDRSAGGFELQTIGNEFGDSYRDRPHCATPLGSRHVPSSHVERPRCADGMAVVTWPSQGVVTWPRQSVVIRGRRTCAATDDQRHLREIDHVQSERGLTTGYAERAGGARRDVSAWLPGALNRG